MQPTVSTAVLFHYGSIPCAAIVTGHAGGEVDLAVFPPPSLHEKAGQSFTTRASMGGPDGRTPTEACWTWAERPRWWKRVFARA